MYVACVYLQLLLEQRDFSNARFPGLIGLFHLSPLSSQSKPDILQFTLQLGLLIILEMGTEMESTCFESKSSIVNPSLTGYNNMILSPR